MNKIDKKQLPQLIALIALSVSVFGFFIYRMIAPTPAAAQSPTTAKAAETAAAKKIADAEATSEAVAPTPAPSALMRDPFLPGVADAAALETYQKSKAAQAAAAPSAPPATPWRSRRSAFSTASSSLPPMPVPQVAPLPNMGGLPAPVEANTAPLPVAAPAAPVTWTVTGVMGGETAVAILRDGESRRIVRQGDMLDGGLRVAHIGRNAVMLERDGQKIRLPLGGSKEPAAPKAPSTDNAAPAEAETAQPIAP